MLKPGNEYSLRHQALFLALVFSGYALFLNLLEAWLLTFED
jgi:hypothetical protein